jgi:flagellar biogenesis protein FliO
MQFLQPYYPLIIGGLAILAILLIGWMIFRLFNKKVRGRRGSRLGISEYHELDKTRRLVLVRRDDTEHLVLIGGQQDLVIESGIEAGMNSNSEQQMSAHDPIPMRMPPRPAVFGNRRPPLRPVSPAFSNEEESSDQVS